ncbi:MAG: rhomboid family intramembrane serine protease [bacterium]|nr:rhomboid family intramembrane serine protease [bacterium]
MYSRAFPSLSPAIKQLMLVNVGVFLVNMLLVGRLSMPAEGGGGFWFAFSWSAMWEGYGLGLLRLVTYQFTHSFTDIFHLLFNMLVLYFFGTMSEARLGYRGTWKLYLLGGAAGAVLHLLIAAVLGHADVPLVGASGACYGFLLYAACVAPQQQVIFFVFPIKLWVLATGAVLVGLYSTFIEFVTGFSGGVSHGAHLGGAAIGYLVCRQDWFRDYVPYENQPGLLTRLKTGWQQKRAAAAAQKAEEREQVLDEILAKVKEHGLGSLTPQERKFLEKKSEETRRGS